MRLSKRGTPYQGAYKCQQFKVRVYVSPREEKYSFKSFCCCKNSENYAHSRGQRRKEYRNFQVDESVYAKVHKSSIIMQRELDNILRLIIGLTQTLFEDESR